MSQHSAEFHRCLEQCDVGGIRRLWKHVSPHLPQPTSDLEAMVALHYARTAARSLTFKLRAYSYSWLCERSLQTALPDELKPAADRLYPRKVTAVGISTNVRSDIFKPAMSTVRKAMEDAVSDAYAEGKEDPAFVKARMFEAKDKTLKQLFGRQGHG